MFMFGGVNNTADKFFAGVNKQLSPVTTTPSITFFPSVIDTGHKEPKSLKFMAGVNDTAEKLFTGVNDTTDKFLNFSAVSTTWAIRQSCLY
jgi:hypothetical protein